MEPVDQRIKRIFVNQLGVVPEAVTAGRRLRDLGADSLDIIDMTIKLEDEYGITLLDADIENCVTVGDLAGLVEKRAREVQEGEKKC